VFSFCLELEARAGIEPTNKGFADLRITAVTILVSVTISRVAVFCPACARTGVQRGCQPSAAKRLGSHGWGDIPKGRQPCPFTLQVPGAEHSHPGPFYETAGEERLVNRRPPENRAVPTPRATQNISPIQPPHTTGPSGIMPDCLSRHCRECNKLLTGGTVLIASGPTQSSTISLIIECGRLEPAGSGLRKDQVVTDNAV